MPSLKDVVNAWMLDSHAYAVEGRIASLSSLPIGFLLQNKPLAAIFFVSVPLVTTVLQVWSEYFVRRFSSPFRSDVRGGLALGCSAVPLALTAAGVCAEMHSGHAKNVLYFFIKLSLAFTLITMAGTVCMLAPPPNHQSMLLGASVLISFVIEIMVLRESNSFWWLLFALWAYVFVGASLVHLLPKSFSAGEAAIVSQALTLLLTDVGMQTLRRLGWKAIPQVLVSSRNSPQLVVECAIAFSLVFGLIVWLCSPFRLKLTPKRWAAFFWLLFGSCASFIFLPWLALLLYFNPFLWLFTFLFSSLRLWLIGYWLVCTLVAMAIVVWHNRRQEIVENRWKRFLARKQFHLLAVFIFVPGLLLDQELLLLASGAAVAAFILLECVRTYRVWPLGSSLDHHLRIFIDQRDEGHVILTHLYLLLGCAMPVFAYPLNHYASAPKIATYAGVISLGIGDTAASLIGIRFGRRKWPKMDKTVEGTLAAFIAQLLACFAIALFDPAVRIASTYSLVVVFGAVAAVSVLEAFTQHVDNLVLPPVLFALLVLS